MASVLKTFTCPICGIALKTVKGYVNHQQLHKNEAHSKYVCCIVGCKSRFTKYSSFKSHILCHHRRSSVLQCEAVQGPLKCQNPHCQKQCNDLKDLLDHLKLHISKKEEVKCPFKGCGKAFSLRSSFTAHLSRYHKHATSVQVSSVHFVHSVPSQSLDVAQSRLDVSTDEPEDILDPTDMKVMDVDSDLADFIDSVLPNSSSKDLVLETLQTLGVETLEDLKYIQEPDLINVLRPIEARKLIAQIKALSEKDASEITDLPSRAQPNVTPCRERSSTRSSSLTAGCFMIAVDQTIVKDGVTNCRDAVLMMFVTYYCLNISYPVELGANLEFMQRCLFKINPDRGTKVKKQSKKQQSVNPKVLSLNTNIVNFEWRE